MAEIEIWAACSNEEREYDPEPIGYFTTRDLASECARREWLRSDEASYTDYEDDWKTIQVKRSMGVPVQEKPVYDVSRTGFSNHPDGDRRLMVWKNWGPYGPGWHDTGWEVRKITAQDALDEEDE